MKDQMTPYQNKQYQEACDAGIVLKGMFVRLNNGTEVLVERGAGIGSFIGSDKDGGSHEFSDEQVTAITGW